MLQFCRKLKFFSTFFSHSIFNPFHLILRPKTYPQRYQKTNFFFGFLNQTTQSLKPHRPRRPTDVE